MQVNYYLNTKYIGNAFYVPNAIVDDYIHSANGNAIKILLIILRNTKVIPSLEQLTIQSGLSLESVKQALKFWSDNKVITIVGSSNKKTDYKNYQPEVLSPSVIDEMSNTSNDIKDIIENAKRVTNGQMISPFEISSLISAYDVLGMPKDVILTLYSDCKHNNLNMQLFNSVISKWASMGVKTLEEANYYLCVEDYMRGVAKIFNLNYLLPNQRDIVNFWNAKNISLELVAHVYNSIPDTDSNSLPSSKKSVPYVNAIIRKYINSGLDTLEKVKEYEKNPYKLNGEHSYSSYSNNEPSYNLAEYERMLIENRLEL